MNSYIILLLFLTISCSIGKSNKERIKTVKGFLMQVSGGIYFIIDNNLDSSHTIERNLARKKKWKGFKVASISMKLEAELDSISPKRLVFPATNRRPEELNWPVQFLAVELRLERDNRIRDKVKHLNKETFQEPFVFIVNKETTSLNWKYTTSRIKGWDILHLD